jgi:hypothetical protein
LLNIPSKEEAEKYKVFLTDEYALRNYFNLLTLFRTDQYIKLKNQEKLNETFKIKILSNVYNKLSLLKTFEKHYKINRFDFVFENVDVSNKISEKFQTLYKNIFPRLTVKSFSSKYVKNAVKNTRIPLFILVIYLCALSLFQKGFVLNLPRLLNHDINWLHIATTVFI